MASSCSGASMCALALCFHFGASPEPYTLKAEDCQSMKGGGSRIQFEVPFDSPHDRAWNLRVPWDRLSIEGSPKNDHII